MDFEHWTNNAAEQCNCTTPHSNYNLWPHPEYPRPPTTMHNPYYQTSHRADFYNCADFSNEGFAEYPSDAVHCNSRPFKRHAQRRGHFPYWPMNCVKTEQPQRDSSPCSQARACRHDYYQYRPPLPQSHVPKKESTPRRKRNVRSVVEKTYSIKSSWKSNNERASVTPESLEGMDFSAIHLKMQTPALENVDAENEITHFTIGSTSEREIEFCEDKVLLEGVNNVPSLDYDRSLSTACEIAVVANDDSGLQGRNFLNTPASSEVGGGITGAEIPAAAERGNEIIFDGLSEIAGKQQVETNQGAQQIGQNFILQPFGETKDENGKDLMVLLAVSCEAQDNLAPKDDNFGEISDIAKFLDNKPSDTVQNSEDLGEKCGADQNYSFLSSLNEVDFEEIVEDHNKPDDSRSNDVSEFGSENSFFRVSESSSDLRKAEISAQKRSRTAFLKNLKSICHEAYSEICSVSKSAKSREISNTLDLISSTLGNSLINAMAEIVDGLIKMSEDNRAKNSQSKTRKNK